MIASLKRRYKRRLLALVILSLPVVLFPPLPPREPPPPMPTPSSESPSAQPAPPADLSPVPPPPFRPDAQRPVTRPCLPPSCETSSTVASVAAFPAASALSQLSTLEGTPWALASVAGVFAEGAGRNGVAKPLPVTPHERQLCSWPSRPPVEAASAEAAETAAANGLVEALLPPVQEEARRARNCGLAGAGQAHLGDASRLIKDEWDGTTAASIANCWVKSTILPAAMSDRVTSYHGEYTQGFSSVEQDLGHVLGLMRSTSLQNGAFGGESARDVEEAVVRLFDAEDGEDAILDTADMLTMAEGEEPPSNE